MILRAIYVVVRCPMKLPNINDTSSDICRCEMSNEALMILRAIYVVVRCPMKLPNINDTSSDICRCEMSNEATKHFPVCVLYTEMRNNLFLAINPLLQANDLSLSNDTLLVKFLLHGDDTFSAENNRAVLTATLNYVETSTRFGIC